MQTDNLLRVWLAAGAVPDGRGDCCKMSHARPAVSAVNKRAGSVALTGRFAGCLWLAGTGASRRGASKTRIRYGQEIWRAVSFCSDTNPKTMPRRPVCGFWISFVWRVSVSGGFRSLRSFSPSAVENREKNLGAGGPRYPSARSESGNSADGDPGTAPS